MAEVSNRGYDDWALTVYGRIESVNELHAADAIYHHVCYSNFNTGKQVASKYIKFNKSSESGCKRGRSKDTILDHAYAKVRSFLTEKELNDEQVTLSELMTYMQELVSDSTVDGGYSVPYLKKLILADFKDQVIISNVNGKPDVITFLSTASKILQDFNDSREIEQDIITKKMKIIKAASDIIRNDIKSLENNLTSYPTTRNIENCQDLIPDTLSYFLSNLITFKNSSLTRCSIAQVLIQNVRPRTIVAPLQLALAVSLHRHFASRYLIDTLNKLGFCSSYSEVQRFESCAAQQNGIDLSDIGDSSSLHFISDNVDHNLDTIDGLNTFHGMGTIACVTPPKLADPNSLVIKRLTVSSKDVIEAGKVEIKYFNFKHDIGLAKKFEALPPLVSFDNKRVLGNL